MSEAPEPPPEAKLIRLARQAKGMSPEDAAPLTEGMIKASRWRQLEKGYATRQGEQVPTRANAPVLARMAFVVGVAPRQLTEAGRADAAEILTRIYDDARGAGVSAYRKPAPAEFDEHLRRLLDLWPQTREHHRQAIVGVLEAMLSESAETDRKPERADERRAM